MLKYSGLFFAFFFFLATTDGQTAADKKIISAINELVTERIDKISPGCAILVSKKGTIYYQKAFGLADLELQKSATPDMVFRIGSITKQFTSVAILQLVEQGKISLADSLQKYITGFPRKDRVITIENLLSQTSGITDYLNLEINRPNPYQVAFSTQEVIDSIKKQPLEFSPGSKFSYSNSNYFLLGRIIELVSGQQYPDYLKQNIFIPLGMVNTFYEGSSIEKKQNMVTGYEKINNEFRKSDSISMSLFYSAGAIVSNTKDLFIWNESLKSNKLLKKATIYQAQSPYILNDGTASEYGYGWFIRNLEGNLSIEHGGSIFGFRSEAIFLPKEDIYITGLFNCRQPNNEEQLLCYDVARTMLGKSLAKEFVLSESILNRYTGTYKYSGSDTGIHVSIKVYKENGRLYADLSNGTGSHMPFVPQSEKQFRLAIRTPIIVDFVIEKGLVTGMVLTQKEPVYFEKVE